MINKEKLIELEYQQLRAEILKRMELRHQMLQMTLTFAGILIGVGAQTRNPLLSSIYPPLALCFAMLWAQNDIRARQLGNFIRTEIENDPGRWENFFRRELARAGNFGNHPLSIVAPAGAFLISELMAVAFCIFDLSARSWKWWLLLVLDLAAIVGTGFLIAKALGTRRAMIEKNPATD